MKIWFCIILFFLCTDTFTMDSAEYENETEDSEEEYSEEEEEANEVSERRIIRKRDSEEEKELRKQRIQGIVNSLIRTRKDDKKTPNNSRLTSNSDLKKQLNEIQKLLESFQPNGTKSKKSSLNKSNKASGPTTKISSPKNKRRKTSWKKVSRFSPKISYLPTVKSNPKDTRLYIPARKALTIHSPNYKINKNQYFIKSWGTGEKSAFVDTNPSYFSNKGRCPHGCH